MSGRWYLDDDQSFYYLETDEPRNIECPPPLHQNDTAHELNGLRSTGVFPPHSMEDIQEEIGTDEISPFQSQNINLRYQTRITPSQFNLSTGDTISDNFEHLEVRQFKQVGIISPGSIITRQPATTFLRPSNGSGRRSRVEKRATLTSRSLSSAQRIADERHDNGNREDQLPFNIFRKAITIDRQFVHPLSTIDLVMGYNTSLPRSRFDAYITALRQMLRLSMNTRDGG